MVQTLWVVNRERRDLNRDRPPELSEVLLAGINTFGKWRGLRIVDDPDRNEIRAEGWLIENDEAEEIRTLAGGATQIVKLKGKDAQ